MTHGPSGPHRSARGRPVAVLLAAGSARWETEAVERLTDPAQGLHLTQRCLDLVDLLGAAATGAAEVAVVSGLLGGLDGDAVARLHRLGVRVVVVADAHDARGEGIRGRAGVPREALHRMEVDLVLDPGDLPVIGARLRDLVTQVEAPEGSGRAGGAADPEPTVGAPGEEEPPRPTGRLLAVWGAAGAPGRTTTAVALAAEAAHRGHSTLLVDADPYGGSVAQHLSVLDEVSGLLGTARLANAGQLDVARLAAHARGIDPGLRVLTGLPRPSRWTEVRPTALDEVLSIARLLDDLVVVDTGPGIETGADDPFDATPNRDATTRTVLEAADAVVVVASPDPVGLQRAARALSELLEVRPAGAEHVVVNRMRPTLGWDRADVAGLLQAVAPQAHLSFVPDDPAAADRALVAGRTLVESSESTLRRALASLATDVLAGLGYPASPHRQHGGSLRPRRTRGPERTTRGWGRTAGRG